MDPIHQFQIVNLFPLGKLGNAEIAFTNSALFMLIAVVGLTLFLVDRHRRRPAPCRRACNRRLNCPTNSSPPWCARPPATKACGSFPFVFTIFMFVLVLNMFGLIPYAFTVTSHIVITAALALLVFFTVLIYGLILHGLSLLQFVRAERRADLHPADDHRHRDPVVHLAADLAQRAPVRQYAGRPHRAQGVRRLHHPARRRARRASAGPAACCRSP